ncbi:MAG TPA: response regulator [Gemmatimonadales bacterium]
MADDPKVLVVEDDPLVRDAIKRLLEHAGFHVTIAPNGLAALGRIRDASFRAVVCDIRLPFLQGNDFYDQLKELFPEMVKRVVFVTGWAHEDEIRAFLERTGQPYLTKPFEAAALIAAVKEVDAAT